MANVKTYTVNPRPGIQRDGTTLDATAYVDGQWVRFQNGKPKKMGGYKELSVDFVGPVSAICVWDRQDYHSILGGSRWGIEQLLVDSGGVGAAMSDRTPSGYVAHSSNVWMFDTIYNDAVGADESIIVAHASRTAYNIDDGTVLPVYIGDAVGTGAFTAISGMSVSGGVVVANPYLITYGSDGYVAWSNANEPENFTTGDAGADRVTATKIVKGLPIRSGQGPAALLWSLDSVIKMQWVGGADIFRFDTLSPQSSIISPRSVVEYDGVYFWVGIDRFMFFDGAVRELPNNMNLNWFFDGLNKQYRSKVWAIKVPRWGEIVWFYPRGSATSCTHAIVFNVRERTWYDFELSRSAGYQAKVIPYPIMIGELSEDLSAGMTLTTPSGVFQIGEEIVGGTSGARGRLDRYIDTPAVKLNVIPTTGTYQTSEVVTGQSSGATGTISGAVLMQELYDAWIHEYGVDRVTDIKSESIPSWFETHDLGLPTGFPHTEQPIGEHNLSRIVRLEPDFLQSGMMQVQVVGKSYARSTEILGEVHRFGPTTEVIDIREQYRQYRLRFASDDLGGDYFMGRVLLHTAPGDGRV